MTDDTVAPSIQATQEAHPAIRWNALTVLAVEDEPLVLNLLARTLRSLGPVVLAASSAEEALGMLDRCEAAPDLVVSDLEMPGIGGLGLIQTLRASVRYRELPLVIVSGAVDAALALDAGADELVAKPYRRKDLAAAIAASLTGR